MAGFFVDGHDTPPRKRYCCPPACPFEPPMNPFRWSFRIAFLVGFVICVALLGYAIYAEQQLRLTPCNLCILQRVAFIWMALWFLIGGLHAPRGGGRWVYVVLVLIGAAFGAAMAIRQLWLQSQPARFRHAAPGSTCCWPSSRDITFRSASSSPPCCAVQAIARR